MTRSWSLAPGEWGLLTYVAGLALGVQVVAILGVEDLDAWAVWLVTAVLFTGPVELATGRWRTADVPEVSGLAYFGAGIPVIAVWWILGGALDVPSEIGPAYITWFVSGTTFARIVARQVSIYAAADGGRPNPRLRVPRSLF